MSPDFLNIELTAAVQKNMPPKQNADCYPVPHATHEQAALVRLGSKTIIALPLGARNAEYM